MHSTNLQKKKCFIININIKKEIYEYKANNLNINQIEIASFFNINYDFLNINRITISKIWQNHKK